MDIPQVGFGTYKIHEAETPAAVGTAFAAGYRSVDTAALYANEAGVGQAIRDSGLPRQDLFITTKLWNDEHGYDNALRAFDASLGRLGLEYVDLYLIHWPQPGRNLYVETWRALETLHKDGRAKAIGVSNFQPDHLRRLLDAAAIAPAVNQIELHPFLQQEELRAFHHEHGILTEAWSPLARGRLDDPAITAIAERLARTPAQVALRWHLQLGHRVIPKSVTPSRIKENIDLFGFELSDDDMAAMAKLDRGERLGPHPDHLN